MKVVDNARRKAFSKAYASLGVEPTLICAAEPPPRLLSDPIKGDCFYNPSLSFLLRLLIFVSVSNINGE